MGMSAEMYVVVSLGSEDGAYLVPPHDPHILDDLGTAHFVAERHLHRNAQVFQLVKVEE